MSWTVLKKLTYFPNISPERIKFRKLLWQYYLQSWILKNVVFNYIQIIFSLYKTYPEGFNSPLLLYNLPWGIEYSPSTILPTLRDWIFPSFYKTYPEGLNTPPSTMWTTLRDWILPFITYPEGLNDPVSRPTITSVTFSRFIVEMAEPRSTIQINKCFRVSV